jgi:outer membrane protein TolC
LGNKAADADFSRAVNERRLSDSKITTTTQAIELQVRNALTQLQVTAARVDTAKVTLDLAKRTLEAEQAKFDLGTSILKFVLEDQTDVATDQTAELQAEVNYTKALIDLDSAMGITLKRSNVDLIKTLGPGVRDLKTD